MSEIPSRFNKKARKGFDRGLSHSHKHTLVGRSFRGIEHSGHIRETLESPEMVSLEVLSTSSRASTHSLG